MLASVRDEQCLQKHALLQTDTYTTCWRVSQLPARETFSSRAGMCTDLLGFCNIFAHGATTKQSTLLGSADFLKHHHLAKKLFALRVITALLFTAGCSSHWGKSQPLVCEQLSRPTVSRRANIPQLHRISEQLKPIKTEQIPRWRGRFYEGKKHSSLPCINYPANTWLGICNYVLFVYNICGYPVSPLSNPQILQPQKNTLLHNHVHTTTPIACGKKITTNQPPLLSHKIQQKQTEYNKYNKYNNKYNNKQIETNRNK